MTEVSERIRRAAIALVAVGLASAGNAQPIEPAPAFKGDALVAAPAANWPTNGGNWYNQRYSPLTEIDRGNVAGLKGVWRTRLNGSGIGTKYSGEAQPIVYDGVVYIVTGAVDKFAINTTKGGFGGIGGSMTTADTTISLRFIDTTTAARVISVNAPGQVKKGGGVIRGASLSRERNMSAVVVPNTLAQRAIAIGRQHADDRAAALELANAVGRVGGNLDQLAGDLAQPCMGEMGGDANPHLPVLSVGRNS